MKKRITAIVMALVLLAGAVASPQLVFASNISRGETRQNIIMVQDRLHELGYLKGKADGVYNKKTRNAVTKFQEDSGLVADGVVGARTEAALGIRLMEFGAPGASVEGNNERLLALLIYREGNNLSYRDKVGLGAIVLNRIRSPEYPKTIAGVAFQPGAFERLMQSRLRGEPDRESRSAAIDALSGFDPTGGSTEYSIVDNRLIVQQ